ncbi:single-stranded DNA-binding protein [Pollutibacter soli]|uniref:single-stranded DNA-binding protein n=1 Tax=Pollutibacter soli TaxID=3034157 RepID=UPI003013FC1C
MKEAVNKVQLAGNLGRDPRISEYGNQKKMARFSITTEEYKTNQLGETIRELQWHNAVAWGKTALLVEQSLTKGKHVVINGRLSSKSYVAKDGTKKYATDIVVSDFVVLS